MGTEMCIRDMMKVPFELPCKARIPHCHLVRLADWVPRNTAHQNHLLSLTYELFNGVPPAFCGAVDHAVSVR